MRLIPGPIRATLACACVTALALLAGPASAESYVRAGVASVTTKQEASAAFNSPLTGPKQKGSDAEIGARFDFPGSPLFATVGIAGTQLKSTFPADPFFGIPETKVKDRSWGYNGGLGYVLSTNKETEIALGLSYSHARMSTHYSSSDSDFNNCCGTGDAGLLYLSGYNWINPTVKLYGEVGYTKASHKTDGYGLSGGIEFAMTSQVRAFLEYSYEDDTRTYPVQQPGDVEFDVESKSSAIGGGIKISFGVPAAASPAPARKAAASAADTAPVATPPAAAMAPVAPAPIAAAGATAKLKDGVQLRAQPKLDAPTLTSDTTEAVTLKAEVTNAGGKWWLVSTSKGMGWVLESDITVQR